MTSPFKDGLEQRICELAEASVTSFKGRFQTKLDAKGRLSLPSALRTLCPEGQVLVMTTSVYQKKRCLDVYTLEGWNKVLARFQDLPKKNPQVQAYERFYILGATEVELSSQGRAQIPQSLRKYADLDSDAVLTGMGEKLELWSARVWEELQEQLAESFDDTISKILDLEEGPGMAL